MSIRTLLVSAGLLVIVGGAPAQKIVPPPGAVPTPVFPAPPADARIPPTAVPVPPVPQVKSVDDLLTELENLRAQKAELEKREQDLNAALRKKLDAQAERLKKLGTAPKSAEPDRVGKIVLEGNAAKFEKEILGAIGMRPGQVFNYPALEEARTKLEKAGWRDVAVEVLPSEPDSIIKDIRIKANAPVVTELPVQPK